LIIKIGKIELNNWQPNGSYEDLIWYRKIIPYENYDDTIKVAVRKWDILDSANNRPNKLDPKKYCYANFYSQLRFLHDYFPPVIEGDLEFAKNYVDNFLVRMSKLLIFL
jgi:hypothetical protein